MLRYLEAIWVIGKNVTITGSERMPAIRANGDLSDISKVLRVADILRVLIDISENHQGENAVRITLNPFG